MKARQVMLGLGSNLGDRLGHLRKALHLLRNTTGICVQQVSPVYVSDALIPNHAPSEWDAPYLNLAIRCEVMLSPDDLLLVLKATEKQAGRRPEKKWGPRIIDIDLLAFGNLVCDRPHLKLPHPHLLDRPFVLWPLADVAAGWQHPVHGMTAEALARPWGSRFSGTAPFHTRQITQRVDTPRLIGILNLTPDSFSGDGLANQAISRLLKQAALLVDQGAEILDVGAEASGPHAIPLSTGEEWQRLSPFLSALLQARLQMVIPPDISIDTRHPETAEKALALDCHWINDVSGLDNPVMRNIVAQAGCRTVMMHQLGLPARSDRTLPDGTDPVNILLAWGKQRIEEALHAGCRRENIIFDPGIGFGKTAGQSLQILTQLQRFRVLGVPLLVGHSRKSFLADLSPHPASERDPETAAASLVLADQVDFLRVHNPGMQGRLWRVMGALGGPNIKFRNP